MEEDIEMGEPKVRAYVKRDEWEIKDDLKAIKRALAIFKDKERLEDVKKMIKEKKESEKALEALFDGDLTKALGL